jgi:hypothetical protein
VAALPAALGGLQESDQQPSSRTLMRRPLVVIPLFLLVFGALVAPFVWPSPSADELFAAAKPLLDSEDPEDWQRAVNEYLDPLEQRFPGHYSTEIAAARERVNDRRELKRAIADGAKVNFRSDAEKAYHQGMRLAQAGDPDAARRVWQALVLAFGPVVTESRWVELAHAGIDALKRPENRGHRAPPDRAAFDAALRRAKSMVGTSSAAEAAAIFRALEVLSRDDAALLEALRTAREGK